MAGRDDQPRAGKNEWVPQQPASAQGAATASAVDPWLAEPEPTGEAENGHAWIIPGTAPVGEEPVSDAPAAAHDPSGTDSGWLPEEVLADHGPRTVDPVGPDRRSQALLAFFGELGDRNSAAALAADTMAQFEHHIAETEGELPDEALSALAREVAANRKPAPFPRRGWRAAVTRTLSQESACAATWSLLAARANGTIDDADRRALDGHLQECLTCRAIEIRWLRAERALAATLRFGAPAPADGDDRAGADLTPVAGFAAVAAAASEPAPAPAAADTSAEEPAAASKEGLRRRRSGIRRPTLPLRGRRLAGIPVLALIPFAALCLAAVALTLAGGSSPNRSGSSTQPVTNQQASVPATPAPAPAPKPHARHHAKPAAHRPRVHHHAAAPVAPAPVSAAPAPVTASAPSAPVTPAPAPVAPAPVVSSPPPSAPASPPSGGSTASIQQPSLGSTSAPTQGISSNP